MLPPTLDSIINRILDADKYAYGDLFNACGELYRMLCSLTGIDSDKEQNRENISLGSGSALGLTWAALCIKDFMRTKRFMDGVYSAVKDKIEKVVSRPVRVLYAGTGPFATLVLPLVARFTEHQVQFILLEVNESSMNSLQELIKELGIEKYISYIEKTDATQWKLPPGDNVDVFICETMQQGLKNEPQVAICYHILPQLHPNAIMIPERIILKASLVNQSKIIAAKLDDGSAGDGIHILDTVFILDKETILNHPERITGRNESISFPGTMVSIPMKVAETHPALTILTEIGIYKEEQLLYDECALTLPLTLTTVKPAQDQIIFRYITGKTPGLTYTFSH